MTVSCVLERITLVILVMKSNLAQKYQFYTIFVLLGLVPQNMLRKIDWKINPDDATGYWFYMRKIRYQQTLYKIKTVPRYYRDHAQIPHIYLIYVTDLLQVPNPSRLKKIQRNRNITKAKPKPKRNPRSGLFEHSFSFYCFAL